MNYLPNTYNIFTAS